MTFIDLPQLCQSLPEGTWFPEIWTQYDAGTKGLPKMRWDEIWISTIQLGVMAAMMALLSCVLEMDSGINNWNVLEWLYTNMVCSRLYLG